jgi:hypothetical protein
MTIVIDVLSLIQEYNREESIIVFLSPVTFYKNCSNN